MKNPKVTCSRVVLVGAMKGGSGKSTKAVLLAAYQRLIGRKVAVFDADASVGTTYLTLRDASRAESEQNEIETVVRFDLRDPEEAREIVRPFEAGADLAVVDMPGGSIGAAESVFGSEYANGLEELGRFAEAKGSRITVFHMITDDRSTAASINGFMDGFGDSADYVAVLNRGLVRRGEALTRWQDSDARQRLLAIGGREIELPSIPPALLAHGLGSVISSDEARDAYIDHLRFLFQKEYTRQIAQVQDWL